MQARKIRRFLGDSLFHLKASLGAYQLNHNAGSVAVLMYHGLESAPIKLQARPLDIAPKHCLAEILFFQKQGYQVVAPQQLDSVSKQGQYLIVTFDDGHSNTYSHLRNWMHIHQLPFTLALCPGIIDNKAMYWWEEAAARFDLAINSNMSFRLADTSIEIDGLASYKKLCSEVPNQQRLDLINQLRLHTDYITENQIQQHPAVHQNMAWSEIRDLASNSLCTIASHSMEHEFNARLSGQQLAANAARSKEIIEAQIDCEVVDYIFPNGQCNPDTERVIQQAGYQRWYSVDDKINPRVQTRGRFSRIRGYGFSNDNLRYYAHQWRQRHSSLAA